jgi:hypothetical protein
VSVGGVEALLENRPEPGVTLLSGPLAHSSTAGSSAPARDGGHGDKLRKPLLEDLWGAGGLEPAALSM